MKIEFDPDKAAANPLNHDGVTFDEAHAVLPLPLLAPLASLVGKVKSGYSTMTWSDVDMRFNRSINTFQSTRGL
jgi:hypothetical protein